MNARSLRLACLALRCLCRALPAGVREENYAEWCAELQPVRGARGGQGRLRSAGRVTAYCAGHALSVVRLRRIYGKPRSAYEEQASRRAKTLVMGATAVGLLAGLAGAGQLGRPTLWAVAALARDDRLMFAFVVLWVVLIRVGLARLTRIFERRAARRRMGAQGGSR
ncbi:hypothetical protein [Streptomyces pseudovenezuelae]|uniref:Type II secretion system protein GspF domain-containing protein n=1 Tax=Streptomyces pseudovenezuelae TaxID=67350 RepID=A0ABT6M2N2_9ACTN|nr:hypothetical protein [Streptomyces pseudovenezuelae]MDH6222804.1 hypothetical protein [Streptomyces pseudovenezuelae]